MRYRGVYMIIALWILSIQGWAQEHRMEIGAIAGVSSYMGDINLYNPFLKADPAYGVVARVNITPHWAVKLNAIYAGLRADSRDAGVLFPGGRVESFQSQIWDFGAQVEFNFLSYGRSTTYNSSAVSPYLILGVGATWMAHPNKDLWVVNMPVGVGAKFKVANRWNLGIEWTFRKCFSDRVDTNTADDPYGVASIAFKNTDWYTFLLFYVSFDIFSTRCVPCYK